MKWVKTMNGDWLRASEIKYVCVNTDESMDEFPEYMSYYVCAYTTCPPRDDDFGFILEEFETIDDADGYAATILRELE